LDGESIDAILPIALLDHKILTLNPSAPAQFFEEILPLGTQARTGFIISQVAEPNRSRRLRLSLKTPNQEHGANRNTNSTLTHGDFPRF
jgi:hypothetical protein